MASQLKIGDSVYVPCLKIDALADHPSALYRTTVVNVEKRSAQLSLPGGATSDLIGFSLLHVKVGILIVEIGDFVTETAMLDPLAKSVLQFCRLLVPDDHVRSVKLRSLVELEMFWGKNHGAYSHVIFIAHGDTDGLGFAVEGDVKVDQLIARLDVNNADPKVFISLGCKTGYKAFGGKFSEANICKSFIGPFHSVHGAIASQFCQTFLAAHLLSGRTTKIAFNHARDCVPDGTGFRLWDGGALAT